MCALLPTFRFYFLSFLIFILHPSIFIFFVSLRPCSTHLLLSASTYFSVRVVSACVVRTLPHLGMFCFYSHSTFFRFVSFESTRPAASMTPPCPINFSTSNEARRRKRSDRGRFLPLGEKPLHHAARLRERSDREPFFAYRQKASSYRGAYRVSLFNLSVGFCLCVTFVVFTDCGSCKKLLSTNTGSMETGEYGLMRGTFFVARRLELVTVAGLLCISCVFWVRRTFSCFFFRSVFFERTRPAASMRPPWRKHLSTSNEASRGSEATEAIVFLGGKKPLANEAVFRL